MEKTVLVTGASQGFGKLIAKKFQKEGWNVIATMRSPEKETELTRLKNVLVTRLDVTNQETISKAVAEGADKFGGIDLLVNNAGYGCKGPLMTIPDDMIRKLMEVNVFGLINVTKTVLPYMEKKGGVIINFSSVAGLMGFPHNSIYSVSKFAVEGFTETLQFELNPIGIKLKLIEPGAFSTGFADAIATPEVSPDCIYRKGFDATIAKLNSMMGTGQDPQEVADITYLAATDGTDKLRYLVGDDAKATFEARKQMNDEEFKAMIMENFNL